MDALKNVLDIAKKVGNIEIQQSLIDVQQQILDIQSQMQELRVENEKLKDENSKLLDISEIAKKIERHSQSFVTLFDDETKIKYCSTCWDGDKKLIQLGSSIVPMIEFKCSIKSCENTINYKR